MKFERVIILMAILFVSLKLQAGEAKSVENWTIFVDLVVKGSFVFEKKDLPDNDPEKYREFFDLRFDVTDTLIATPVQASIVVPVLRYIIPNESATLSRGAEQNIIIEKSREDTKLLAKRAGALSQQLDQGEISKGEFNAEMKNIMELNRALPSNGKIFFVNPFAKSDFFISPDKEYILFLRCVDVKGNKSCRLLDNGGTIFEDVERAEGVVREIGKTSGREGCKD